MNETQLALTILMEECSEVAKACSKAIRFGLTHFWEKEGMTNAEAIMMELGDVKFMVNKLIELDAFPANALLRHISPEKEEKYTRTIETSRRLGVLT